MNSSPSIPRFELGTDYVRGSGKWKWRLKNSVVLGFPVAITKNKAVFRCFDSTGKMWAVFGPRTIWVSEGYAWNGSSCSPDLPGVLLASCVHDAIYQFSGCPEWPAYLAREWADDLFHNLSTSRLRLFYRIGLALGSWSCWGRPPVSGERVVMANLLEEP